MSNTKIENIIISLAIITSVLSFSESDTVSYYCSNLMYVFWGVEVLLIAIQRNIRFNLFVLLMLAIYAFWTLCSAIFSWVGLYSSSNIGVVSFLLYCAAFYLVGFNYRFDDETMFKRLIIAFAIGQILLMATMAFHLDHATNELSQYKAKNQMGQMLGIGIVFELIIVPRYIKSFVLRMACMACGISTFIVLLYIRSRTPVVAVAVVVIYMFILRKNKQSRDYWTAAITIIALAFVVYRLGGSEFLFDLFKVDQSVTTQDYNQITSGRLDLYKIAWRDFVQHPLIGVGAYAYIDSFFFNILRCGGALLTLLLLPISYGKMFKSFQLSNQLTEQIHNLKMPWQSEQQCNLPLITIKVMILYYFVVSLMEGYPPLGPGASVFFLWIFFGILDRMKKELLENG